MKTNHHKTSERKRKRDGTAPTVHTLRDLGRNFPSEEDPEGGSSGYALIDKIGTTLMKRIGLPGVRPDLKKGSINGTLCPASSKRMLSHLRASASFGCGPNKSRQRLLDAGSGQGNIALGLSAASGVPSIGIEVVQDRHEKALLLAQEVKELNIPCCLLEGNLDFLVSMEGITHLFMFNVGIPWATMQAVARAFNQSGTTEWLVLFKAHKQDSIHDYGFNIEQDPMVQFEVFMAGSGECHSAMIFRRQEPRLSFPKDSSSGAGQHAETQVNQRFKTALDLLSGNPKHVASFHQRCLCELMERQRPTAATRSRSNTASSTLEDKFAHDAARHHAQRILDILEREAASIVRGDGGTSLYSNAGVPRSEQVDKFIFDYFGPCLRIDKGAMDLLLAKVKGQRLHHRPKAFEDLLCSTIQKAIEYYRDPTEHPITAYILLLTCHVQLAIVSHMTNATLVQAIKTLPPEQKAVLALLALWTTKRNDGTIVTVDFDRILECLQLVTSGDFKTQPRFHEESLQVAMKALFEKGLIDWDEQTKEASSLVDEYDIEAVGQWRDRCREYGKALLVKEDPQGVYGLLRVMRRSWWP